MGLRSSGAFSSLLPRDPETEVPFVQHRQVRVQARLRGRQAERQSLATEVQLDHRPWWQSTGVMKGKRYVQKLGSKIETLGANLSRAQLSTM
jgi:hypothetical protein